MIAPTVGRIVYFFENTGELMYEEPKAAIITAVWSHTCINVAVFAPEGKVMENPPTSITLVQPEDKGPPPVGQPYCEWMPYQVKKTTGSESGESAFGTQSI